MENRNHKPIVKVNALNQHPGKVDHFSVHENSVEGFAQPVLYEDNDDELDDEGNKQMLVDGNAAAVERPAGDKRKKIGVILCCS
ncbi:hypothetical protein ElyMa_003545700 [Elysia marginata]|uniref:CTNNB1 binding N-teminal domain-containing protein n=1 Tax=Elysia marginata TaxID=1093978 RepID=A0AAV4EKJ6_9GAST|nr:hypothetical protein ElyMa_003545700 [Elysia marginata]